ncbi:MAG: leucine-rich repeat protein [Clostridia bacterium]|nr:leucine-rich repeat protein [Clostridia bacterium]
MKNKLLFSIVLTVILALSISIGVFASDIDGFKFAEGEMYEIAEFFDTAPSAFEANLYLEDTVNSSGVVFGNFYRADTGVPAFNFSIEAGGIPTLTLHTAANTDTVISFDDAVIESGKLVNLKVVLDRTEGAQKALCYIDSTIAQTIDMDSIPAVSGTMYQFVFGGDRSIGSEYQSNPNYFKGVISSFNAYDDADALLISYSVDGNGNTAEQIKDQSGNGYDAVFSKQYLTAEELPERIEDYAYSFAVVGDPQYVAHYKVSAYVPMYEWIVSQSPEYVINLGDITDWNIDSEWAAADQSISLLDEAGIPHTHIRGNHDNEDDFNTYLSWSEYGDIYDGITAGAYEDNLLNTWRTIEIGDTKWLIIGLAYEPDSTVLKWASEVVEAHPEHNVIIATHAYLDRQGNPYKTQYDGWSKTTEIIWAELADKYSNVVMTLCGHVSSDNVIVKQRENSAGTMVTEMLIDFQSVDLYYDTLAMVTMFHFSEDGKTLQVENYSTDNKAYFKNINQFTVTLDTLDVTESSIKNSGTADYDLTSATESGTINGYTYSLCGDTLVISGSSDNTVLTDASAISAYASTVKKIVIENSTQITELGDSLFSGFTACETVVIPAKLTKIGSKTFGGMTALNTVALYNDYYSGSFANSGIIDISSLYYLSADSFNGASAVETVKVYMPKLCKISGDAQKLLSATAATYYAYPTSAAATFVRATADDSVTLSYYTVEMTGDTRLTREGINYRDDGTTEMFNWNFDDASGKLTLFFTGAGTGFRSTQGFADWKAIWADAILSIEVTGYSSNGKIQTHDNQSTGIFNGYKNLISILFVKTGYWSACSQWQFGSNDFGMFSDNPKLTSIGMGTLTDGVVDLAKLVTVNNNDDTFDEMFRGCTSITKVILPSVETATNLYTSMFEGCTSLTSVTLPSALTTIGANSFKGCTSLKFITIPSSVTSIDSTAFDADILIGTESIDVYNTVTGYGYNAAIDIRSLSLDGLAIERTDASLAVLLAIGTDVTEYTADALNEKFGDNVTYYVYPTSSGATAVREMMEKNSTVKMIYYPESIYPELVRSGENKHNGNIQFIYSIDESTGLLTITTKTTYGTLRGPNYEGHIFIPWKLIWADAVTAIEVVKGSGGSKIQYQSECTTGIFDNYPNLVSIDLNGYYTEIQNNANANFGVFENNPKLTTLISSGNVDSEGIYFNALKKASNINTLNKAFRGCTSITKVVLRTTAPTNGTFINANMFEGCVKLEDISIPSYITAINAGAFAGCTALKNLVLTNSAVTVDATAFDNTDTKLICLDETQVETINTALAGGTTDAKAVYLAEAALTAEGLAIRESGYNGLRYFYSFDASTDKVLSSLGYTLAEYGVILTSGANADKVSLTFDGTNYITGADNIIKYAIVGVEENGKVLSDTYSKGYFADYSADKTYFAGTVKEFTTANYNSEIYVTAYAIYKDAGGNEYIGMIDYADYGSEEYRFASIYDVTLDMYIANAGCIRSRAVEKVAVWDIILSGAVSGWSEVEVTDGVTVTVVADGDSNVAFVRNTAGGTVSADAITAAETMLTGTEYSDIEVIGITILT